MRISELQEEAHRNAVERGFWEEMPEEAHAFPAAIALVHLRLSDALEADRRGDMGARAVALDNAFVALDCLAAGDGRRLFPDLRPNPTVTRLALIHSEVSEAVHEAVYNDSANLEEELADIEIRPADLAGGLGLDLEGAITRKMEKNGSRPYKHGKRY